MKQESADGDRIRREVISSHESSDLNTLLRGAPGPIGPPVRIHDHCKMSN